MNKVVDLRCSHSTQHAFEVCLLLDHYLQPNVPSESPIGLQRPTNDHEVYTYLQSRTRILTIFGIV